VTTLTTNIIVRHLMQDDPRLSPLATRIIEEDLDAAEQGFISTVVLAEVAWVLRSTYKQNTAQIVAAFEQLLRTSSLVVEASGEVFAALILSRDGFGSFTDALISQLAKRAGCTRTLSFDRGAANLPGFSIALS